MVRVEIWGREGKGRGTSAEYLERRRRWGADQLDVGLEDAEGEGEAELGVDAWCCPPPALVLLMLVAVAAMDGRTDWRPERERWWWNWLRRQVAAARSGPADIGGGSGLRRQWSSGPGVLVGSSYTTLPAPVNDPTHAALLEWAGPLACCHKFFNFFYQNKNMK